MIAIGYGISQLGDDDSGSSSSASPSSAASESSSDGGGSSGEWKTGDCGGPDPDRAPDGYKPYDCDDADATFKALKIMDGTFLPDAIQCPAGTDLIIEVSMTFGSDDDGNGGIPTDTVCGRNLSGDHPGDAGAGGGQLVAGDCVSSTAQEIACASAGAADFKVLDLVEEESACPSGTTEPMRLTLAVGRPYNVICARSA
ncbi:hypothetical protein [Streptomyces pseudoechinosporeus]